MPDTQNTNKNAKSPLKKVESEGIIFGEEELSPPENQIDQDISSPVEEEAEIFNQESGIDELGKEESEPPKTLSADEIKKDILSVLPKVEAGEKPEAFTPKNEEEKLYAKEHAALPTTQEHSDREVLEDEARFQKEIETEKKDIEAHQQEVGTMTSAVAAQAAQAVKSDEQIHVESILQENLAEQFKSMDPKLQVQFKVKGEETASTIVKMMRSAKVQIIKVLELIKNWLKMIPGVNKFFLEQETKIKLDKIIQLKKDWEDKSK
jgi:hypothetical protein